MVNKVTFVDFRGRLELLPPWIGPWNKIIWKSKLKWYHWCKKGKVKASGEDLERVQKIPFRMKFLNSLFLVHCLLQCYANNLRIVYVDSLLYHSERVQQVKFHGHSSQKPSLSPKIKSRLLIYCQSYWVVYHKCLWWLIQLSDFLKNLTVLSFIS